jgi:hypothetical protein
MRLSLPILLLALGNTWAAENSRPYLLTPNEVTDGWIMLFDRETAFGWKAEGDVTVTDGKITVGGAKDGTLTSTTQFGPGTMRFTYQFRGNQPAIATWQGKSSSVANGGDGTAAVQQLTGEGAQPSPIQFRGTGNAQWVLLAVAFHPLRLESIFDGKDLDGWKKYTGDDKRAKSTFTVTPEGWINVKNGPGDLQSEKQWADFVFQGECISNGKHLNSGVFFRCIPGQYQNGYEFQIQNGYKDGDRTKPEDFGTGAIYRRVKARKVVPNDHEWFTMTLIAHGNHIATWVNGYQTVDWTDTRPPNDNARNGCKLGAGPISLQGHDKTTDLSFRNLRIAELKKD